MAGNNCKLFLIIFLISPYQIFSASHCVMYGFCGENDYAKATCSYNGTALPLNDEEALETLKKICPDVLRESNLFCCSAQQVEQLKGEFEFYETAGLGRCPSCLSNLRKIFCQFSCSAKQSHFLKVTALDFSDEGSLVIGKISYFMSRHYADGMFNSCKDIRELTSGSTLLDLMCGGWGRYCNAQRWLNFMGSTPQNNGFSPVEVKYHLTSEKSVVVGGETFFPMNENATLCSESPYPGEKSCTCLHCEAACQLNSVSNTSLPTNPPRSVLSYDLVSLVFAVLDVFFSSVS